MIKKNFLFICLIGLVAFVVNVTPTFAMARNFTNYYGVEMTDEEYSTLLNLGFSEDEIYYMTEKIFNENKDASAELLAKTVKYYKTVYPTYGTSYTVEVTEEEFNAHKDDGLRGTVTTAYKTIISTVSANGSRYRFKVTETWTNLPSVHSYDVIGIGYTGNIHIQVGPTFYYTYTTSNGNVTTSYSYFNMLTDTYGGTATFHLPSAFVGMSSTMYYDVDKDAGAGTITSLYMCGDYAHATQTVTGAQAASHSIDIGGITFSPSVANKFDATPCAYTNLNVSW